VAPKAACAMVGRYVGFAEKVPPVDSSGIHFDGNAVFRPESFRVALEIAVKDVRHNAVRWSRAVFYAFMRSTDSGKVLL
jgi:hypothetical protein